MPTPASLPSPTAPTGFEAVRETLSNLLLLLVIAIITTWAESLIASLRQRTETTDLTDITRAFGTTDIALIIERLTTGLQRLRELEDKVRRAVAGLDTDPQLESASATSSPLSLCASQPLGLTPEDVSVLSPLVPELMAIAPVRATGPPEPETQPAKPNGASPSSHTERHGWPRRADSPPVERDEIRLESLIAPRPPPLANSVLKTFRCLDQRRCIRDANLHGECDGRSDPLYRLAVRC